MALGIIPEQQDALSQQMKIAEKLRYGNNPEMRSNGRVSTAAHPLEFLAATLQGIKANKQIEELRKRQDELMQKQVEGRGLFYKKLRGGPQQAPAPIMGDYDPGAYS